MRKLLAYLFFIFFAGNAFSQGFDWQYSARLPFEIPKYFIGVTADFDYYESVGNFNFAENEISCCRFRDGKGYGWSAGLAGERWLTGSLATFGNIKFEYIPSNFKIQVSLPRNDTTTYISEYEYQASHSFIDIILGLKYRIMQTHFHVGAAVKMQFLLIQDNQHLERIISPPEEYFPTNPPSQERQISKGQIPEIRQFIFTPSVQLGYDLNLGLGTYSTPYFSVEFPVMDAISEGNWRRWAFSAGLRIYYGIK
ncbi:MAG: hypothetical protein QG635_1844 [Bacteroidota bacterium]|nr:hypothetical protein [Bacteroidota bacterium]